MAATSYHFLASLYNADGVALERRVILPDWTPATESARLAALRQCRLESPIEPAEITPLWEPEKGKPFMVGARAAVKDGDGREAACEVDLTYFRAQVQVAATDLVKDGRLKDGETFQYSIAAIPNPKQLNAPQPPVGWQIQDVSASTIRGERSLQSYLAIAAEVDSEMSAAASATDIPVFIPLEVLRLAEQLKTAATEKETGGVLIGNLWRDTGSTELFLEVTALVPAKHTLESSTSLQFTPQTWTAVAETLQRRNRGEIWCGWWHTHPAQYWCKCDEESQKKCPLGKQFFSVDDVSVHRTVFTKGFHVALVTGDIPKAEGGWEMSHALYGWRSGMVQARSFHAVSGKYEEEMR